MWVKSKTGTFIPRWSFKPHQVLAVCREKPTFLDRFKTLSICLAPGIEPATLTLCCSAFYRPSESCRGQLKIGWKGKWGRRLFHCLGLYGTNFREQLPVPVTRCQTVSTFCCWVNNERSLFFQLLQHNDQSCPQPHTKALNKKKDWTKTMT